VNVDEVMTKPIAQQLVQDVPVLHMSYTALDGSPRVIPLAYLWDGSSFRIWTIPSSPKVHALRADPRVAITVDVVGPPPRILLVRGRAQLDTVPGVPDGYLEASHRTMPREAWDGFDAEVGKLYDEMVVITITPDWAKLIDFETNAPSAVEQLVRERGGGAPAES
jgi:Pyridoxamine 5'-phosphate oxidase